MSRSYLIAITYSFIIHILVILLFFNYIKSDKSKLVGYQNLLHAYVINQPSIISKYKSHLTKKDVIPANAGIYGFRIKSGMTHESDAHTNQSGEDKQLLIILHNRIQQQINDSNYNLLVSLSPRSAVVQFLLTPQGKLVTVRITKSSGVNFLDNLAIKAVNSIQPCYEARKYLATNTYFRIKVYFR